MRLSNLNASKAFDQQAFDPAAERAVKAACLLREALDLLGGHLTLESATQAGYGSDRLLRLPEVQRMTGLRRSAIYEQMRRGIFPRSVKAGARTATWSEAAIQAWIAARIGGGQVKSVCSRAADKASRSNGRSVGRTAEKSSFGLVVGQTRSFNR